MKSYVEDDAVVDLGDARIETRGSSPIGERDEQPGLKTFVPGIQTDD